MVGKIDFQENLLDNSLDYANMEMLQYKKESDEAVKKILWTQSENDHTDENQIILEDNLTKMKIDIIKNTKNYWESLKNFRIIKNDISFPCKADEAWFDIINKGILKIEEDHGYNRTNEMESEIFIDLESSFFRVKDIENNSEIDIYYIDLYRILTNIVSNQIYSKANLILHTSKIKEIKVCKENSDEIDQKKTIEALENYDYRIEFSGNQEAQRAQDIYLNK